MNLPDQRDLDEMAFLVGKVDFDQLGPESRIQIIQLVQEQLKVEELEVISDRLKENNEALNNLDCELTKIGDWFRCSKLFEGLS